MLNIPRFIFSGEIGKNDVGTALGMMLGSIVGETVEGSAVASGTGASVGADVTEDGNCPLVGDEEENSVGLNVSIPSVGDGVAATNVGSFVDSVGVAEVG